MLFPDRHMGLLLQPGGANIQPDSESGEGSHRFVRLHSHSGVLILPRGPLARLRAACSRQAPSVEGTGRSHPGKREARMRGTGLQEVAPPVKPRYRAVRSSLA